METEMGPEMGPAMEVATTDMEQVSEPANKKTFFGIKFDNGGIQRLVVATIKQAIQDYNLLRQAHVIVDGKLSETLPRDRFGNPEMPRKVCVDGMTIPEVKDTINFFKDENIGVLLRLGGIEIEPERFRIKLGLK